jgi:glycosyltransferase involved in cell wall biosynthesis
MLAYACDPRGTGEHWLGWGWVEQAARSFQVDLITTPKAREAVTERCAGLGVTPHFVSAPGPVRALTKAVGGAWLRKLAWQRRAARLAAELHARHPFALVHQTTFHTFRVPFLAAGLGIPSVWGPIAGGESVPPGFQRYLGRAGLAEATRSFGNRLCLRLPGVRRSLEQASVLFVSNRTTAEFLPPACRAKSVVVPPNALRPEDEAWAVPAPCTDLEATRGLKLLYVGNCVATRALPLVFDALRQPGLADCRLTIVGGGPALADWQRRASRLGLSGQVRFAGKVPFAALRDFYADADALVFPALRDSGGSAVLEAMARYLPVICLDWAGPAEMLDEQSGLKVRVGSADETMAGFAAALLKLSRQPRLCRALGLAARARAEAVFRWEWKRELLEATYRRLLGER